MSATETGASTRQPPERHGDSALRWPNVLVRLALLRRRSVGSAGLSRYRKYPSTRGRTPCAARHDHAIAPATPVAFHRTHIEKQHLMQPGTSDLTRLLRSRACL